MRTENADTIGQLGEVGSLNVLKHIWSSSKTKSMLLYQKRCVCACVVCLQTLNYNL